MINKSEHIFWDLISDNREAKQILREILLLDKKLERMRFSRVHPISMNYEINKIQILTFKAGNLAANLGGGDPIKHADWLSYNIHKFENALIESKFPIFAGQSEYKKEPPGCLIILMFLATLAFYSTWRVFDFPI